MALDPKGAALALHRFGFGPRAGSQIGSIAALAPDPLGALLADLDAPNAGRIVNTDLPSSGAEARALYENNAERLAKQKLEQKRKQVAEAGTDNPDPNSMMEEKPATAPPAADPAKPAEPKPVPLRRQIFLDEAKARYRAAINAEIGLVERLVWFWSNHFCVNFDSTVMAGAYEREAIRPHVLGRFADMLLAAESHPAMLFYLDNASSIGPTSVAGINRDRGLNENLAREILELHTLGVRTVYSQADVTNFAKVITGWSIIPPRQPDHGGEFTFNPRMHEPGVQTVAARSYADSGFEQGRAVLLDLARHPATAQHIATKLARHFIADEPPPRLVEALKATFISSDGNLKQVARVLVSAPEAWDTSRTKLKRPGEWLVAATRATGVTAPDAKPIIGALNMLGEPLWRPPAPKGFDDVNAAWMDGLAQRLDVANQFSRRVTQPIDPKELVETALGPLASPETRQAVARAETRPQAVALLLMSAEFQRR